MIKKIPLPVTPDGNDPAAYDDATLATLNELIDDNCKRSVEEEPKDTQSESVRILLPGYPEELSKLPHQLGELQMFIFNRMTYPSMPLAGITALATLTAFAQTNVTIKSRDGLGLNEYYMILAPTGFGKEDIRKPAEILDEFSRDAMTNAIEAKAENGGGDLSRILARREAAKSATKIRHAAPASAQGTHEILENSRSVFFLSDEFAEWLRSSHSDGRKQEALGYLMQVYTKANGTIEPGHAVTKNYTPVKNPRLSILATSTSEAMFETLSREQADSGAYNRWVIHLGDQELPQKRYTGLVYKPEQSLVEYIAWVKALPTTKIKFSPQGFQAFIKLDDELAEPIKRRDGILGGRLSEQAIKMAALIALADKRLVIDPQDFNTAFNIRIGLYHRAAVLARHEGNMDGLHATGKALNQLAELFRRSERLYISSFKNRSRKYAALSLNDQKSVISMLITENIAQHDGGNRHIMVSQVYGDKI